MTIVNNRSGQSRTNDRWSGRNLSRIP
jgi:hypothetical protein